MSFLQNHKLISKGIEPEVLYAIGRMTVKPSAIDTINYNDLIKEIKIGHSLALGTNNLHPTFRLLQFDANHHPQVSLLNWAITGGSIDGVFQSSYGVAGTIANFVHVPYKSMASLAVNNHIGFPIATLTNTYRLDASWGTYTNDNAIGWAEGSALTNGATNILLLRGSTTNITGRFSSAGASVNGVVTGNPLPGLFVVRRTGNTVSVWHNGVQKASTGGVNDAGDIIGPVSLLGIHGEIRNGDVVGAIAGIQMSQHYYGTYAINQVVMKNAIENYMAKYP